MFAARSGCPKGPGWRGGAGLGAETAGLGEGTVEGGGSAELLHSGKTNCSSEAKETGTRAQREEGGVFFEADSGRICSDPLARHSRSLLAANAY